MNHRSLRTGIQVLFCSAALAGLSLHAHSAQAATVNVTANAPEVPGDNKCGLGEAIKAINNHATFDACTYSGSGADKIVLPAGTYTESATLSSSRSLTIQGAGFGSTFINSTVQNGPLFEFSQYTSGTNVVLSGVRLAKTGGSGANGVSAFGPYGAQKLTISQSLVYGFDTGGIYASGVNLAVVDSLITNNQGSGIACDETLNVDNSSITENSANQAGGGIAFYGSFGASKITNSTIAVNSAEHGGGIYLANVDEQPTDSFTITASTISYNIGGGVEALAANYNVRATIIGSNTDASFTPQDWQGPIASLTDSVLSTTAGTTIVSQSHNLLNTDPLLFVSSGGEPVWVGGKFFTTVTPLVPGSPAIDFVSSVGGSTEDQRHFPRGIPGGTGRSTLFDVGAMEYDAHFQGETLLIDQNGPHAPTVASDGNFSNGKASWLNATGTSDFVTYQVPIYHDFTAGQPGQFRVRVKKGSNEGKVTISWAHKDNPSVWTTLGTVDLYSASAWYGSTAVGPLTNFNTDATVFKFQITGKNSASSGYQMYLDYIDIVIP